MTPDLETVTRVLGARKSVRAFLPSPVPRSTPYLEPKEPGVG
mgnify:CR=1 FL=1